ncbi:MAG: hypothetical protein KAS77_02185, partial [Thermoplasmata archaeon]|nr:hypothetical protein [Thermoplasmata archaeon]
MALTVPDRSGIEANIDRDDVPSLPQPPIGASLGVKLLKRFSSGYHVVRGTMDFLLGGAHLFVGHIGFMENSPA